MQEVANLTKDLKLAEQKFVVKSKEIEEQSKKLNFPVQGIYKEGLEIKNDGGKS